MMELWYALVDLLPFEWAQPGSMYFMKNALLAVLVISPLFGILSTMVVHSRMSFFSDALGHSAFTGMAIGALCGFSEPTWAAVLFSLVFALLFNFVRRRTRLASDTVIGVFSSTAVALGIFISTLGSRSFTKFNSLLIGDILSVEPGKIGLLVVNIQEETELTGKIVIAAKSSNIPIVELTEQMPEQYDSLTDWMAALVDAFSQAI